MSSDRSADIAELKSGDFGALPTNTFGECLVRYKADSLLLCPVEDPAVHHLIDCCRHTGAHANCSCGMAGNRTRINPEWICGVCRRTCRCVPGRGRECVRRLVTLIEARTEH